MPKRGICTPPCSAVFPVNEINQLNRYWQAFPQLCDALFNNSSTHSAALAIAPDEVKNTITQHTEVNAFAQHYAKAFVGFDEYLQTQLITPLKQKTQSINIAQQEGILSAELFTRLVNTTVNNIALIDKYHAYQLLNNQWQIISADLEMLQTEGYAVSTQIDPNMVTKKVKGKDTVVQDGWVGHILPFGLVQTTHLSTELQALKVQENRLAEINGEFEEIIDSFSEEEKGSTILNDTNTAFNKTETTKALKGIYAGVESDEIDTLKTYIKLLDDKVKKPEKIDFYKNHNQVEWTNIQASKDGTYGKANVNKYILSLQSQFEFEADLFESKIVKASNLLNEEKALKKAVKTDTDALHLQTKSTIENLSDSQVEELLALKWITPLLGELNQLPAPSSTNSPAKCKPWQINTPPPMPILQVILNKPSKANWRVYSTN